MAEKVPNPEVAIATSEKGLITEAHWSDFLLQRWRDPLENETSAWIWFDVANSCFATVGLATFLPLVLNSYATSAAWAASTVPKPPSCSDLSSPYSQACIECRIGEGDMLCLGAGTGKTNCIALETPTIGGINPTSFAFLVISLSCISQLIAFMLFSETADHTDNRRGLLTISSLIGAGSLLCFAFFPEGEGSAKYVLASLITIVSNTAFGMAQVYYNAYLPLIAADQAERSDKEEETEAWFENKISSYALAGGYWSGVVGLILSIGVLTATGGTEKGASEYKVSSSWRWAIVLSAVWWFVGTLLTIPRLQPRSSTSVKPFEWMGSVKSFGNTIAVTYKELPITFRYLLLYFAYSDGYSTIAGLGLLYTRLEMCAGASDVFVIAIEAPFMAAIGNFFFLWLSRKYKFTNQQMVIMVLLIVSVLPAWGLLGYLTDSIGFRNYWEAYVLGAWFGLCLGAIQNFSRTLFIEMIPKSKENEYFAFYELTDKGSSWLGPLVVSALATSTSLRLAFVYILFMTLTPCYFLYNMDMVQSTKHLEAFEAKVKAEESEDGSAAAAVATPDTAVELVEKSD